MYKDLEYGLYKKAPKRWAFLTTADRVRLILFSYVAASLAFFQLESISTKIRIVSFTAVFLLVPFVLLLLSFRAVALWSSELKALGLPKTLAAADHLRYREKVQTVINWPTIAGSATAIANMQKAAQEADRIQSARSVSPMTLALGAFAFGLANMIAGKFADELIKRTNHPFLVLADLLCAGLLIAGGLALIVREQSRAWDPRGLSRREILGLLAEAAAYVAQGESPAPWMSARNSKNQNITPLKIVSKPKRKR